MKIYSNTDDLDKTIDMWMNEMNDLINARDAFKG